VAVARRPVLAVGVSGRRNARQPRRKPPLSGAEQLELELAAVRPFYTAASLSRPFWASILSGGTNAA
jgi:hypothetical protein